MTLVLILSMTTILYHRTLSYGLVIDDIEYHRRLNSPLFHPTFAQRYLYGLWGLHPHTEHAITLSLHLITISLIYQLSPVASALYSCHPCNHQTAIWLTGRRYSLINILVLTCIVTHTAFLLPPAVIPILAFAHRQYQARRHLTYPTVTPARVGRTAWLALCKLSGLPRFYFLYQPSAAISLVPFSQPCAERHLNLPLILLCLSASKIPLICALMPLLALRTIQLIPMYANIQAFYSYHSSLPIEKLRFLKKLYHEIKP